MDTIAYLMGKKKGGGGGGDITVESLSVTENGTYTAPSGKAYTPVNVNVPLPANAYLLTTITDGDLTSAKSKPLPSVSVAVTDADELDVFVGDSETITSDNEPYIYRQSKGGRMVSERLVGASVAWNQLVPNGNFESADGWEMEWGGTISASNNELTITITSDPSTLIRVQGSVTATVVGHVYLQTVTAKSAQSNIMRMYLPATNQTTGAYSVGQSYTSFSAIAKADAARTTIQPFRLNVGDAKPVGNTYTIKDFMLFDLTLMFGSTIADYVYSLERSTAGSGIAWLKSYGFFSEDYYAYDSGSLKSVQASEKKVVGFNQWDEQWESGGYDASGNKLVDASLIRNKTFIKVMPNTNYYIYASGTSNGRIFMYDESKTFIQRTNSSYVNRTFTTTENCHYINFHVSQTTYNNDICINISDPSKNGTYEPYKLTTYPLPSSDLRGLYKLSSNKLQADGDIQYGDGWRLRRYGIVDLGELEWSYSGTYELFWSSRSDILAGTNMISNGYAIVNEPAKMSIWGASYPDKSIGVVTNVDPFRIGVKNSAYSDATAFKTAMSGVYLIYELATPVWEKTHPFTNPQTVGSTEEFVANLPVGHESKYYDGDIHHSYIYSGDARAKVTGDVDIVNGTAPNATCSVCVVMPDGEEIWSDAGDVTAEIWT